MKNEVNRALWAKKKIYLLSMLCLLSLSLSAQTYKNGTWYSIYDVSEHAMNTQGDYETGTVFAPAAGQLNVQWRYEWIDWLGAFRKIDTEAQTSSNGGSSYNTVGSFAENTDNGSNTTEHFSVNANINRIKFNRSGLPTHKVIVYHIDVPLAKHILLASGEYGTTSASKDFGEVAYNTVSEAYTVNLRSFLSNGDITVSCSDTLNFHVGTPDNTEGILYAVGANACASANGKAAAAQGGTLGNIANYAFPVYFTPKACGTFVDTVTITDGTSTAIVALSGTAPKEDQTITWLQEETELLTNDTIVPATASSELEVEYTFAPEGIVAFADGAFTILSEGMVTITASQAGNDFFNPALPVAKTFSIYPAETDYSYSAEICEGAYYSDENFENLTEAGLYLDTLPGAYGADSIISFTLIVHPLFSSVDSLSITEGDSIEWQGIDLSVLPVGDTTFVAAYQSIYGCDSTYTLYLHVKPLIITYGYDTIHACSGETVVYEGKTYKRSANDTITLAGQNYAGGDSIVYLSVIFTQPFSAESYLTITVGDAEVWQDIDLSVFPVGDTTLVAQYQTIHGCDSTYMLYLTVEDKEEGLPFTEADQVSVQKVVINGTLYIRKGDELFDLSGRKAR